MSKLDRRLQRLESRPGAPAETEQLLPEKDWIIFHKIAKEELVENLELLNVTEADTDPTTWRHLLQMFVYARFPTRPDSRYISIPEVIRTLKSGAIEVEEPKPTPWQALPKELSHAECIEMALAAARQRIAAQSTSA